jgi:ribosomal protein S18 acetylase RimI-like enzyme
LVRPWTQADVDYVTESVQREGWGYTRRDIERCWQLEPKGCFIAEVQNQPVGHVFTVGYNGMGWIGLLIVCLEKRGRGVGTILMNDAINYLRRTGRETIRLEAAERAVPLYRRLGFKEEFVSLRFRKKLKQREEKKRKRGGRIWVRQIREEDMEGIAKFDARYFGADRRRVLKSLYLGQSRRCFVAKEKLKTLGYIMSRKIVDADWIGPWVCEDPETAQELLQACTEAIREGKTELRLGMPILNTDGIRLMEKLGFQPTSESMRMVFGKRMREGDVFGIYGIGGPEKG